MSPPLDWLSRLLNLIPVRGQLDVRCHYGAPWRIDQEPMPPGEMPYHVVLAGSAVLEDLVSRQTEVLTKGDILLLAEGGAHALHDGSGAPSAPTRTRTGLNVSISENAGQGEPLDLLCGRFVVAAPHDRLLRDYLPPRLVVHAAGDAAASDTDTALQLERLLALMRSESSGDHLGGRAMLNGLSTALFALTLRLASQLSQPPSGLLALAGHPRLAPALTAMFSEPARAWTLPELAQLCSMSRATFVRHFQDATGRTAGDLLADIRMTLAARELRKPLVSIGAIADSVGYRSEAAFQRAFKHYMGTTPARWRRQAQGQ